MRIKSIAMAALCLLSVSFASCAKETRVRYAEAPLKVRQFMGKHFGGARIDKVIMDTDDAVAEFDIYLADGTKVEVDQNGNWKEVSNRTAAVPTTMLPDIARKYIAANYPDAKVVKVDRDRKGYDVKFANGVELEFDTQGNFLRIDH